MDLIRYDFVMDVATLAITPSKLRQVKATG